jgi:Ricin-type beta-trefoil lectin domain
LKKFIAMNALVIAALPACSTDTYVSVPDPIPVIGAQIMGSSGECIDAQDGLTADGTPIVVFQCHGSPNERWFIRSGVISESFGSCLDVQGSAPIEAAPIILVTCNGAPSQRWSISNGQIVGLGGKCIVETGGSSADETPLMLSGCAAPPSRPWTVQ